LDVLGDERGVYQLFEREQSVYFGKTEGSLKARLYRHKRRFSGRLNIKVEDITFRCLYVDSFVDAASPERLLIKKYKDTGLASWNHEGFGPKDVGRARDGGSPGPWFLQRPVDYQASFAVPKGGQRIDLLSALQILKETVPFDLLRFASDKSKNQRDVRDAQSDYPEKYVTLPSKPASILDHLRPIMEQLPAGWQATVLPHGVILYKDRGRAYDYALDGWMRTDSGVQLLR
jgi:hypothetical protein